MKPVEFGKFLVMDPRICHGQLTFKGTRVPVETILNRLAKGRTIVSLLESWPEVTPEAIAEAVLLAKEALLERCAALAGTPQESTPSGQPA
jgi:uncharacterized protein (DUF433 family)